MEIVGRVHYYVNCMGRKYKICLLEEDSFIAGLYARKFETRGWKVDVVDRASGAMSCIEDGADLLIVDIEADNYGAKDVVHEVRGRLHFNELPIIVLTGVSDRRVVSEMMGAGIQAYLLKGHFVPSEVVEKVHFIIESGV